MARVFLSYSSSDRSLTERTAAHLEDAGHAVWWDTDLVAGDAYRSVIDAELDSAEVVIVVWTPASVRSQWVIAEADHASRQGKLLPLRVSGIKDWQIPKPFGTLHTQLVEDRKALLNAVERVAERGDRDGEGSGPALPERPAVGETETTPETQIVTYLVFLGLLLVGGSVLATYWSGPGEIDKATLLLAAGTVLSVGSVLWCFRLCRRTRNPVYSALLTSLVANMGVHGWLVAAGLAAYLMGLGLYQTTILGGLGALAVYAVLLGFQLRGAAWVLPAARLMALVQAGALSAHVARQFAWWSDQATWFTTHPLALLHLFYVSTGTAGAAIAAAFLVTSFTFSTGSTSAGVARRAGARSPRRA